MVKPKFYTTVEAGEMTGKSRASIWRLCTQNPGLAIQCGAQFRIPEAHIRRLIAGERAEAIAADARSIGASRAA
jgi:hypothetical protein